ncbi:amidohydrolase family protein [Acetobacter oeni]|uniref:Organophopsphate acid anhydrase n=1 Tax=Acetobacter oeni TaxID=304077 RepID=A0A511XL68_9PROT|nr:amidohydrolase family protein [Acetobacter oeni]MBB3883925.1 imidazolonepropionase-like amidohydrolase [Acetobacter oeni]NHO19932.1 amidohydrolase family protein [Acetobacter oeni]GBR02506.1 amidohydrolase [Acetobacter oeni LMG 21952]GEN63691.1 organophopsphate acid anhydrase [Acetobacter oeni]
MKKLLLLCVSALIPGLSASAYAAETSTLFEHVRVIDGTGAPARTDMAVLVRHGKITAVTPMAQAPSVPDAKIINLAGQTMIPGLVSDHSHVGLVSGTSSGSANFTRDNILAQLRQFELYGVTTVVALGVTKSPLFDDLRREQHAGLNAGADLFGVDQGIGVPDGAPPVGMMHVGDAQVLRPATPDEARADVDKMASEGTDLVKIWVDNFKNGVPGKSGLPVMKSEITQAVITHSHEKNLRVAAHIHDLHYAKELVGQHVDILAHGVRDQPADSALISAMKAGGVWYIPTISLDESVYLFAEKPELLDDPELAQGLNPALRAQFADPAWREKTLANPLADASRKAVAMNQKNLVILTHAGVNVGFGTDSGATPLRIPGFAEHRELRLIVAAGLTPLEALHLATAQAAALMHLTDRGIIAPGKRADLVILKSDPTDDITAVDQIASVWRGGEPAQPAL